MRGGGRVSYVRKGHRRSGSGYTRTYDIVIGTID